MSSQSLLLYFATWLLLALTPGPAVICVMSQAARYGWQAGFRGILGIQLGNFVFFLCIAFGLIALLSTATHAFVILQLAGAVYLLYLGLRIIISSLRPSADALQGFGLRAEHRNLVAQALFVQLTNPKALLFVSALLPQFLDPHRPMAPQLTILPKLHCHCRHGCLGIIRPSCSSWDARISALAIVEMGRIDVWRSADHVWHQASRMAQVSCGRDFWIFLHLPPTYHDHASLGLGLIRRWCRGGCANRLSVIAANTTASTTVEGPPP